MVTSCRVKIYFLENRKIYIFILCSLRGACDEIHHTVTAFCNGTFSAIHKKCEIRGVCAKADIIADDTIIRIELNHII